MKAAPSLPCWVVGRATAPQAGEAAWLSTDGFSSEAVVSSGVDLPHLPSRSLLPAWGCPHPSKGAAVSLALGSLSGNPGVVG